MYPSLARNRLEQYLATRLLPKGIGDKESACSIAAINLALTGEFTDEIPDCMSLVIGRATITLQDAMPSAMRNSARYKKWLPDAAGTGRGRESERLGILLEWMWSTVLPELQSIADTNGFGKEWLHMCTDRTAYAAADAARAAADAARAARAAARAAYAAAYAAARAARAAADAADVDDAAYAVRAAADVADVGFWNRVCPIDVLERMTYLETV